MATTSSSWGKNCTCKDLEAFKRWQHFTLQRFGQAQHKIILLSLDQSNVNRASVLTDNANRIRLTGLSSCLTLSTLHGRCAVPPSCAVTLVTRLLSKIGPSSLDTDTDGRKSWLQGSGKSHQTVENSISLVRAEKATTGAPS